MNSLRKHAFITGVAGQDGRYLAELLISKQYRVFGLVQGGSHITKTIAELAPGVEAVVGDLADTESLVKALELSQPDEVYNLGAISSVALSFEQPVLTGEITGLGALRLLEAVRLVAGKARYFQASSSEMFGRASVTPQTELTPFYPRSPYSAAKLYAHNMTINYRDSYDMFACNGILYNHESPYRGYEFVTRKITSSVARIKLGIQDYLSLGNMDVRRDWGFAGDYVMGMWLMLQQDKPDDYILATGHLHSIKNFVELAFAEVGIRNWHKYVKQDARFLRPIEVDPLVGDASKAKKVLGWKVNTSFEKLVKMMVKNDLEVEKHKIASNL